MDELAGLQTRRLHFDCYLILELAVFRLVYLPKGAAVDHFVYCKPMCSPHSGEVNVLLLQTIAHLLQLVR